MNTLYLYLSSCAGERELRPRLALSRRVVALRVANRAAAIMGDAVRTVLECSELVEHILSHLSGPAAWSAARVCSKWRVHLLRRHRDAGWPAALVRFTGGEAGGGAGGKEAQATVRHPNTASARAASCLLRCARVRVCV